MLVSACALAVLRASELLAWLLLLCVASVWPCIPGVVVCAVCC